MSSDAGTQAECPNQSLFPAFRLFEMLASSARPASQTPDLLSLSLLQPAWIGRSTLSCLGAQYTLISRGMYDEVSFTIVNRSAPEFAVLQARCQEQQCCMETVSKKILGSLWASSHFGATVLHQECHSVPSAQSCSHDKSVLCTES